MTQRKKGLLAVWLFCLFFLPLTMSLGFWQLDRAAQKETLQQNHERMIAQKATPLYDFTPNPENFRPYRIKGRYAQESFLLDNRVRSGQVGYEVLHLFRANAGFEILVNRGWLAAPRLRNELPDVAPMQGMVEIEGFFYQSDGEVPLLDRSNIETLPQQPWPKRVQKLVWDEFERLLPAKALLRKEFRLRSTQVPGALTIHWKTLEMGPDKHTGYAVQWFALSLVLVGLTLYYSLRAKNE